MYWQKTVLLSLRPLLDRRPWSKETEQSKTGSKRSIKTLYSKTIFLECSVQLNYRLKIVEDEPETYFDHYDESYVNLLFDRSIYQPMCTHMGNPQASKIVN